jgi:hypothetical protein
MPHVVVHLTLTAVGGYPIAPLQVVVTGGLFRDIPTPDTDLPYGSFREQLMPQHGTTDTRRYVIDPVLH